MTPELQDRVINRLIDSGAADKPWALALLAALEGATELNAYLDNTLKTTRPQLSERATSGGVRTRAAGSVRVVHHRGGVPRCWEGRHSFNSAGAWSYPDRWP